MSQKQQILDNDRCLLREMSERLARRAVSSQVIHRRRSRTVFSASWL